MCAYELEPESHVTSRTYDGKVREARCESEVH